MPPKKSVPAVEAPGNPVMGPELAVQTEMATLTGTSWPLVRVYFPITKGFSQSRHSGRNYPGLLVTVPVNGEAKIFIPEVGSTEYYNQYNGNPDVIHWKFQSDVAAEEDKAQEDARTLLRQVEHPVPGPQVLAMGQQP